MRQSRACTAWMASWGVRLCVAFGCIGVSPALRAQTCPPPEWSSLNITSQTNVAAVATSPTGVLYAAARFRNASGQETHDLARWDGASWSAVGPNLNGGVNVIAPIGNGAVLAGGSFNFNTSQGIPANNIVRWTGSAWEAVGFGTSAPVRAILPLPSGDFVVAGSFTVLNNSSSSQITANGIARRSGSRWFPYAAGFGDFGAVYALALTPTGELIAGGISDPQFGGPSNNVARWNGTSWTPLGSNLFGAIDALAALPNGDIVVGGDLLSVDGVRMNGVTRWDGTAWRSMNGGLLGSTGAAARVLSLTVTPSGDLIAGGFITSTADGIPLNRIARWDGRAWYPLGSGVGGAAVSTITTLLDGSVVVGGGITSAGGLPVNNLAKWNGLIDTDADGLPDDWECSGVPYTKFDGTLGRVLLPGANRLRKDLFVEVDVMQGAPFSQNALTAVRAAFDAAPVAAPAGVAGGLPGITLHTVVDEQSVPFADIIPSSALPTFRDNWFGTPAERTSADSAAILEAKSRAYRYALFAHRMSYPGNGRLLGIATGIPGTTFSVSLGGLSWTPQEIERQLGATFMHELGHTLGLCHGGGDHINYKPNYVSVMNYNFDVVYATSGALPFPPALDYSRERLAQLNEACLNEQLGVMTSGSYAGFSVPFARAGALFGRSVDRVTIGSGPVDWNNNQATDPPCVREDLNWFPSGHPLEGQPTPDDRLDGFDDWQNLQYRVPPLAPIAVTCAGNALVCELTEELVNWHRGNVPPPTAGTGCDSVDFNNDGVFPDDNDLADFVRVLGGGDCPTCNDVDFNNDGVFPDDSDLAAYLRVLGGGNC